MCCKWKMPSRFQRGRKERRMEGGRKENIFIHFWIISSTVTMCCNDVLDILGSFLLFVFNF